MKNKKGFTLIELMIVACIVGIVVAIAIPPVFVYRRHSIVTVDGKQVFSGRAICVTVKSAGASTEVDIGSGPFCVLPGDHYVSKDVNVVTH